MGALTLHTLCAPEKPQCAPWLSVKPQKTHKFFRLFKSLHKLRGLVSSTCTVKNSVRAVNTSVRSVVKSATTKGTKVFQVV